MKTDITQSNVEPKVVLAKSLLNTADQLGLKEAQLASIIGVNCDFISNLKANPELDPATKQGELAILLIEIYRAVYVLSGRDSEWIHYFMNSYNDATKGVLIEQIQTISGLNKVLNFVDSVRAKM
ncbi:DUF2384 domain-containing protein [Acinetobacter baumannii]|uniref:DUF2384 domain-containing protein n=1 Tax=Acinetobacter baumannii TaxID=470 RepID=UPI00244BF5FB|nr:DUF2384 domain-containing protein [Acinetobacter baumannii]MDH2465120.1 DUF2384 domain-containing protein [Acinetobacter baumannii]